MKKIILAFDGTHFSEGAFEFARRLNELQPLLLTGVFLPQAELANMWSYASYAGGVAGNAFIPLVEEADAEIVKRNIERFEKLCQHNGIDYRVHKDFYGLAIPELKKESRYADLLILGSEAFYASPGTQPLSDYLQDALHDVACPVLLVPEQFEFPESIILSYDGSEDSVFAIKQFAYLFPELSNRETVLVYASEDEDSDFPDKIQMEELVARHFSDLTLFKLDANPKKYFDTWMMDKKTAMLVSGSYGRSGISRLFKKSFIKEILAGHRLPVFIAHQ
jgi:nucleotide-binding universal stress UspA family protein